LTELSLRLWVGDSEAFTQPPQGLLILLVQQAALVQRKLQIFYFIKEALKIREDN
jgi:hypothetical protein